MNPNPHANTGVVPRHRIAVLNDSWDLLRLMRELLEDEGYAVDIMHATEGAHQRILETKPDLLILDMVLEKPDAGWQLLQIIKLDPQTNIIPIIICSAATDVLRFHKVQIDQLGCHVLHKPFDLEDLLKMVLVALNEHPSSTAVPEPLSIP